MNMEMVAGDLIAAYCVIVGLVLAFYPIDDDYLQEINFWLFDEEKSRAVVLSSIWLCAATAIGLWLIQQPGVNVSDLLARFSSWTQAAVAVFLVTQPIRFWRERGRNIAASGEKWRDTPEPGIKPLCDVLNTIPGVRTRFSCEGHPYSTSGGNTYVAFRSDLDTARKITSWLRELNDQADDRSNVTWELQPHFWIDGSLLYGIYAHHHRLRERALFEAPHFTRKWIDQESLRVANYLAEAVAMRLNQPAVFALDEHAAELVRFHAEREADLGPLIPTASTL